MKGMYAVCETLWCAFAAMNKVLGNMMERILVPIDFWEPSLEAVRYAFELANAVG
jgi:hypothetical protein